MSTLIRHLALILLIIGWTQPSFASFKNEMESMFNSMTNVTDPSAYKDQRRGVYNGGAVTVKNRIVDLDLISFQPPSITAGCGGVDIFAGSFSFVDADRIVQLLRAVGSNATGYFFKIALAAICPSCEATMTQLQKTIQQMNDALGNSCKLAMAGVNSLMPDSVMNRAKSAEKAKAAQWAKLGGIGDDFQTFMDDRGKDFSNMQAADPEKLYEDKITGNLAWRILVEESANGQKMIDLFDYGNDSDNNFALTVMSLTGTLIVRPAPEDPANDTANDKAMPDVTPKIPILKLDDVMGSVGKKVKVNIYKCVDDEEKCMEVARNDTATEITTFVDMVDKIFNGSSDGINSGSAGLITKFITNSDTGLSSAEKSFMEVMPEVGKRIRDLAIYNPSGLYTYAAQAKEAIALEMATSLLFEIVSTMKHHAAIGQFESGPAFISELSALESKIMEETKKIQGKIAQETQLQDLYLKLMESGRKYNLNHFPGSIASGSQSLPGAPASTAIPVGTP